MFLPSSSFFSLFWFFSFDAILHLPVRLSVSQRQCRFAHESDILETSPIYSFNLCQNECRLRLALKTCGCVPHFYRSKSKYTPVSPSCLFLHLFLCVFFLAKVELFSSQFQKKWFFFEKKIQRVWWEINENCMFNIHSQAREKV